MLYGSRRFVIEYQLPMKRTLLAIGVAVLVSMMLASAQPTPQQSQQAKAFAIYAPRPNYPKDPQGRHPTGSGIMLMEVDKKTGLVKSARMEKSAGNKLLDDAALQAFSQWRFKPGPVWRVHSPITFTTNASRIHHRMAGAVISD
jgi:TonB family protein